MSDLDDPEAPEPRWAWALYVAAILIAMAASAVWPMGVAS